MVLEINRGIKFFFCWKIRTIFGYYERQGSFDSRDCSNNLYLVETAEKIVFGESRNTVDLENFLIF